jgi:superfamily II DNA/RNA helicase
MQRLELTWIGKDEQPQVEPRILLHDPSKDYGNPNAQNMLIHGVLSTDNLLTALQQGFDKTAELGGQRKAVIFTESRRTQNYLFNLLSNNGYKDQIVFLNGVNNDAGSKEIYNQWKERHKSDGKISGSRTADIKAAIVEEFRDRASILIGTEAASEGINLQFCSIVVNYDLPWNPQRIEQRIGRCHRYGQKNDVVVINFLNNKNAADRRVYELLDQKFTLFSGVFGKL